MKQSKNKKIISRISSYIFEHKILFTLTLSLAFIMTILSVMVPSAIQRVLDQIFAEGPDNQEILVNGILLIGGLFCAKEIFNCLRIRVNNKLEQKVILSIRKALHNKLLNLPINFYDKRKSGDIASRVVEDVQNVERAILDGTEQGIIAVLTLFGVTIMMFVQEPRLAALVFLPLPILLIMAFKYSKISKKNWKEVREASGNLNSLLVEDIQGNRLIHAFDLKDREKKRFFESSKKLEAASLKAMYRWSIQGPTASFTSSLGILACSWDGGISIANRPLFFKRAILRFSSLCKHVLRACQTIGLNK
jgi:ABC-type multidrug transport system fused ATPase/permease subunit